MATTASSQTPTSGIEGEQSYYANAHPYIEEPLKQLTKRIPQLKDLKPARNQDQLPEILEKAGSQVDDFFRHITDLTAREEISLIRLKQDRPYTQPELSGEHVHDSYLILRHGSAGQSKSSSTAPMPRGAVTIK